MSQGRPSVDRRRQPRLEVGGSLLARVQTLQAPIIDLSTGGALVDVETALRPGTRFVVLLPLDDQRTLRVRARVVRSKLVSLAKAGQPAHYRAALEFIDMTDADTASLSALLHRLRASARAEAPATDPPI